ncbi:MAG: hypothetical protein HYV13_00005 [Candidatus Doudnabacteria bacterium]|nr:hypothetical protein [Candidatus Doudnabacteria bacterium]
MALAAAATSTPVPATILVVGFNVDEALEAHYRGKVLFQEEPHSLMTPQAIPVGIEEIWLRSGAGDSHQQRLGNLADAVKAKFDGTVSSLPALRDRLETRFPPPPAPPKPPSPELQRIRAVATKPGTVADWVRQHMSYPCEPGPESKRLRQMARDRSYDATEGAIYQAVLSILDRAGLRENTREAGSNNEVHSILTEIQSLIASETDRHNTLIGSLRSLQMQVKAFEANSAVIESLRTENAGLRRDLTAVEDQGKATQRLLDDIRIDFFICYIF